MNASMNARLGALRVSQAAPSGAAQLRAAAPRAAAARVALSVEAGFTSQERRTRRHLRLRKKARDGDAAAWSWRRGGAAWRRRVRRKSARVSLPPRPNPTPRVRRLIFAAAQLSGSEERPRLAVFRSNQHIYAQARARDAHRRRTLAPRPPAVRACVCFSCSGLHGSRPACAHARQVIDDTKHITLVGLGSVSEDVKKALDNEKRSATKNKARDSSHMSACSSCHGARRRRADRRRSRTQLCARASRRADASAATAWARCTRVRAQDAAAVVGRMIAEKCKEKGIESVVFDRGGFKYHGRIVVRARVARRESEAGRCRASA
jgi:large subunit ribosomal protein L18